MRKLTVRVGDGVYEEREILLLDRLVKEGRAYYDPSTRRWRIRDL